MHIRGVYYARITQENTMEALFKSMEVTDYYFNNNPCLLH